MMINTAETSFLDDKVSNPKCFIMYASDINKTSLLAFWSQPYGHHVTSVI